MTKLEFDLTPEQYHGQLDKLWNEFNKHDLKLRDTENIYDGMVRLVQWMCKPDVFPRVEEPLLGELKRCPFCGKKVSYDYQAESGRAEEEDNHFTSVFFCERTSGGCGGRFEISIDHEEIQAMLISAWNRRTP